MPTTLTPKQVATQLHVHGNTVRQWCDEYGALMSDSARGRPRLLTAPDVAVLQAVKSLRDEGLARSDILERLRQTPTTDLQTPYIDATPPTPATAPETSIASPVALDIAAVLTDLAVLVDTRATATQEDVRRIDERLRKIESQRLVWIGVAVGLVAGVVLGVIVSVLVLR